MRKTRVGEVQESAGNEGGENGGRAVEAAAGTHAHGAHAGGVQLGGDSVLGRVRDHGEKVHQHGEDQELHACGHGTAFPLHQQPEKGDETEEEREGKGRRMEK